ncbi:MAG: MBL fold metallo-hydrolase [Chloroflexi bacterium]|nr:MBL fold metallo-hydrolase [Chloroflexota bacterium]
MQIQLVRSATLRVHYGGKLFLIDPFLLPKHSYRALAGREENPTIDLPMPVEDVLADIEMVLISHLHTDHFCPDAKRLVPKHLPLFCQPGDDDHIVQHGFENVTVIDDKVEWEGITITHVPAQHGSGKSILRDMGDVSGFVFEAEGEPTVYWAGDTILYDPVKENITRYRPDIIITHSGGGIWGTDKTLIIMDAAQTIEVCKLAPEAKVIAVHLEALDHCLTSREEIWTQADANGIAHNRLLIPADGETLTF